MDIMQSRFDAISVQAEKAAGGIWDFEKRSATYLSLFKQSGNNHVFALMGAHAVLWGRNYLRFCLTIGGLLTRIDFMRPHRAQARWQRINRYAKDLFDINRRVCRDGYIAYHFSAEFGTHPGAEKYFDVKLLKALNAMHQARKTGRPLPLAEQRELYEVFFRWEQEHTVKDAVEDMITAIDWPLIEFFARHIVIKFAFQKWHQTSLTGDFAKRECRVKNGLRAFDIGAKLGWQTIAEKLVDYKIPRPTQRLPVPRDRALCTIGICR